MRCHARTPVSSITIDYFGSRTRVCRRRAEFTKTYGSMQTRSAIMDSITSFHRSKNIFQNYTLSLPLIILFVFQNIRVFLSMFGHTDRSHGPEDAMAVRPTVSLWNGYLSKINKALIFQKIGPDKLFGVGSRRFLPMTIGVLDTRDAKTL